MASKGSFCPGSDPSFLRGLSLWWSRAAAHRRIKCHINDLPSVVDPQTAVRLFADDCLVYRSITSNSDHRQLQLDLQALSHWGECWGMKFNVDKCHVLHIGRSGKCGIRFYEMNQVFLSEVQSAKYLGVLLSSDMSWSPHISPIVHKAHQRLGFIRCNLRGSPFKYREIACQSLVHSQLKYCATVWDPTLKCDITKLEQIQQKAARWARGEYGIVSVTLYFALFQTGITFLLL